MVSVADQAVTVGLADSNPLVLSAMSEIFDRDPRFSLVTTTATAEGFLGAVMRIPVMVGVIDWQLPVLGGQKLTEVLRAQANAPRLVVYGDEGRADLPRQAMMAGAAGFVARNAPVDKLLDHLPCRGLGANGVPVSGCARVAGRPADAVDQTRTGAAGRRWPKGLTNRELAHEFGISDNTVKFHLSNLFEKLDVPNRAKAIAFFYASGAAQSGD